LPCELETQKRLLKIFRHEIKDWEKRSLVKGEVLAYHFNDPSGVRDSLWVSLDIPAVKIPDKRSVQLPNEAISQIPSEIMNKVTQLCVENQIKLDILDYEFKLIKDKERAPNLYRGASVEEIIHFASVGTKVALELLDMAENREITLDNYKETANLILSRLKKELGDNYFWLPEAFHFVCNPMLLNDSYLWTLLAS
jgi:hypothetical protein